MPVKIPALTVRGMVVEVEIQNQGDDIRGPEYSVICPSAEEDPCQLEADVSVLDFPFEVPSQGVENYHPKSLTL